jgi:hypothetical protein
MSYKLKNNYAHTANEAASRKTNWRTFWVARAGPKSSAMSALIYSNYLRVSSRP